MAEGVGFEEGMPWLPRHVLDELCDQEKGLLKHQMQQSHRRGFKVPAAEKVYPNQMHSRSSLRTQRTRSSANFAAGGPGMRAVFLDSGQRSCGTGVFLPRRAGTDLPLPSRPACAPVLLPSRVVQALNLNVDDLGLQIKPQRDTNKNLKESHLSMVNNKKGKDVSDQNCSPEIFLPKEWTY